MLNWALMFLIVAIIAGIFGFAGVAVAAAGLAKFIFFLFLILFLLSLLTGLGRRAQFGSKCLFGDALAGTSLHRSIVTAPIVNAGDRGSRRNLKIDLDLAILSIACGIGRHVSQEIFTSKRGAQLRTNRLQVV